MASAAMALLPKTDTIGIVLSRLAKEHETTVNHQMNVMIVPDKELIVIQWKNLNSAWIEFQLLNEFGEKLQVTNMPPGSTIVYFDTEKLYAGMYYVKISDDQTVLVKQLKLEK